MIYLLDVEGTVAPVSLVTEQLFPYARTHCTEFLEKNIDNEGVSHALLLLMLENRSEKDPDAPQLISKEPSGMRQDPSMSAFYTIPRVVQYLHWLMDRDRKSTALKSLQGKIWKAGYENGELTGTLFSDVPAAFERWSAQARIAIYSSGSVEAQQLIFRHSCFGDLTPYISSYFDTATGPKRSAASYAAIATATETEPGEILFLSDVVAELDAAREAGCATRLVTRPGNTPVEDAHGHAAVSDFESL
jgi:enolase-phosphatase E1